MKSDTSEIYALFWLFIPFIQVCKTSFPPVNFLFSCGENVNKFYESTLYLSFWINSFIQCGLLCIVLLSDTASKLLGQRSLRSLSCTMLCVNHSVTKPLSTVMSFPLCQLVLTDCINVPNQCLPPPHTFAMSWYSPLLWQTLYQDSDNWLWTTWKYICTSLLLPWALPPK